MGRRVSSRAGSVTPRSPLDTVIAETLRSAACNPTDAVSVLAVAEAVDELLTLDPRRRGSWRLRGLAEGYDLFDECLPAPTPVLERARLAGVLDAAVDRGDAERVKEIAAEHSTTLAELIASADFAPTAGVLDLLLDVDLADTVRLAGVAIQPFPGWQRFVDGVLARTDGAQAPGARPLTDLLDLLERWAAISTVGVEELRSSIERVRASGVDA